MQNDHTTKAGVPAPLVYNGEVITARSGDLSLTDMWRAAGADTARQPAEWSRSADAERFISVVAETHNLEISQVMKTKRGKGGGTFAHWQIALAYAKYLSPEFHMWCNTVVRERMEGRSVPTAVLPPEVLETLERSFGIQRMLAHKVTEIEKALPSMAVQIATEMLPAMIQAAVASQSFIMRRGKTAGQIWKEHGFPPLKVTCWFSNRLKAAGCAIDGGGCGELGLTKARLYDPDRADQWLRNGGRLMVEQKIAERKGQSVIPFPRPSLVVSQTDLPPSA